MKRVYLTVFLLAGLIAYLASVARMVWAILCGSEQADHIAVAYDQLGNATLNGSEDETISSRANRARSEGRRWGCILCRILDKLDQDHCRKSAGM